MNNFQAFLKRFQIYHELNSPDRLFIFYFIFIFILFIYLFIYLFDKRNKSPEKMFGFMNMLVFPSKI